MKYLMKLDELRDELVEKYGIASPALIGLTACQQILMPRMQELVMALEFYASDIVVEGFPHTGNVTISGLKAKEALAKHREWMGEK